ncbi:MAG: hypothetical protein J07HQW2_00216 [Haloquadratum walsbyi J07HQW2]|uniref:Uncharacterized protein n=2 Tax=Haloquadratum walsbyi TaxID=293091 RepID=U1PJE2_9EURY|nr:MAG: hypothetical protein J07HQW2_00216 [Haloquadratum walsbyi J07HQW2]
MVGGNSRIKVLNIAIRTGDCILSHTDTGPVFFYSVLFIICSWGFPVTMDGRSLLSLLSALLVGGFILVEPFNRGLLIVGILMLATAGICDLLNFRAE